MIIDLLHNQIISDTITDSFAASVEKNLVPALTAIYGDRMQGIQMYEDHLADEFLLDGVFYYPLTVILQDEQVTHWISWHVTDDGFTDHIPYAYLGEDLFFDLSPVVEVDLETAIIGRSRYCEGGLIKIHVHSTSPSPTFLAGKYSQTFVDEMARQLTAQISEKMSVEGLAESGLALELEFAPLTFMEHNSENVTYRRLLLTDGASNPRDFWVKWVNHRSNAPYTVSDHPASDEIEFLIGEGVPQKIREREYRHLIRTNNDKYQSAMGKRNITEWRDLIKRAVKRGRLVQVIRQIPLEEDVILVNAALASVAGLSTADVVSQGADYEEELRNMDIANELAKAAGIAVDQYIDEPEDEVVEEESTASDIDLELLELIALNKGRQGADHDDDEIYFDEIDDEADEDDIDEDDSDIEDIDIESEIEPEDEVDEDIDEEPEQLEVELIELDEEEDADEADEEPVAEESVEADMTDEAVEAEEEPAREEIAVVEEASVAEEAVVAEETPVAEEATVVEEAPVTAEAEKIEEIEENTVKVLENVVETGEDGSKVIANLKEIRDEIQKALDSQIRLEYETKARETAEREVQELRRNYEQLIIENRRLEAQAKKEYEERRRISEQRKLENEKLRAEIETKSKAEARERERLVEAARNAVEEKHRIERERLAEERRRIEDERRIAEDRAREEAEARVAAERALEAERIRLAAAASGKNADEPEEEVVDKYADYTYIAKNVKLQFRGSVDYNITYRIQEIMEATLKLHDRSDMHIRVRATVPDQTSVLLEFLEYPQQELELLCEIIKNLGASGIGIGKAVIEDPKR